MLQYALDYSDLMGVFAVILWLAQVNWPNHVTLSRAIWPNEVQLDQRIQVCS